MIRKITEELKENFEGDFEADILCANDLNIEIGKGCMQCFESKCSMSDDLGKLGITVSVSNTNGNKPVNAYLYKILDTWGADIAANVAIQQYIQTEEQINTAISTAANRALEAYIKRERNCSENQRRLFHLYKNVFSNSKDSGLKKYWAEHQYFNFNDVEGLLHQKMQEPICDS